MAEDSPWTKFDIVINLIILISLLAFSTVILILKAAWVYLGLFWVVFVVGYMLIGRYVTCRHCDHLGKPCPSWCMGIIGKFWGFKRSGKKNFCVDGGFRVAVLLDISFLIIAAIIPVIVYIIEAVTFGLAAADYILLTIYLVLVLMTLGIHSVTGCKKCDITDCPMSGKKNS
jgi:hypothetical protein